MGTVTVAPVPRGTYPYMSPEIMRRERGAASADVWAVAVMLADCFYVGAYLAAQGEGCVLYSDAPRAQLVPAAAPGPGAPPDGLLEATRQMLALEEPVAPTPPSYAGP